MCGIVGIIGLNHSKSQCVENVLQMMDAVKHRGPDDAFCVGMDFDTGKVCTQQSILCNSAWDMICGFRRLSILDLSQNGRQPMIDPTRQVILEVNGEIYNAEEIFADSTLTGKKRRGRSDSEVLLHLYLQYGIHGMLARINGIYAGLIADIRNRTVYMFRDRFGVKPLYYIRQKHRILYASEMKAFLKSGLYTPQINEEAVGEYMLFRSPYLVTLLRNVQQVEPGELMTITPHGITHEQYYTVNSTQRLSANDLSEAEAFDLFRTSLQNSVTRQKRCDVPFGVQLSGGIDSAVLAGMLSADAEGTFPCFSIIPDDTYCSEEKSIDCLAERKALQMHKLPFTTDDMLSVYQKALRSMEAILTHPNAMGFFKLTEYAQKYVKVLISGEGSDELLGGYKQFAEGADIASNYADYAIRQNYDCGSENVAQILNGFREASYFQRRYDIFSHLTGSNFSRHIKYEIMTYLPDLLIKQDKMSMAHSIENRVPYLDYEFVDTAMCLPESYLLHFIQDEKRQFLLGKYMLRRIAGELYGSDYIYQKKIGFPLPIKAYLQSDLFSAYVHENVFPSASQRGLLNVPVLKEWFDNLDRIDYQKAVALWKGICLESWCQIYLDQDM